MKITKLILLTVANGQLGKFLGQKFPHLTPKDLVNL